MEALRIRETAKTPEIIFDPANSIFEIKGKSVPDNAEDFYTEVLNWIDDYVANPLGETVLKINLEYFNISSSKRLLFLLYKLNELASSEKSVKVQWFYNKADEDMFEVGQDYAFMVKFPFEFIEYSLNEPTLVEAS
ncbi:DUF1987 domain-containing protein [Paracrocinitomix mangrovi]|uniref:DUF1987 domain-containing protein n=1 Tax=Paracrocinitomix mangrovi TaxID=2862509 RepID=UPI001C8D0D03|nr:DUF1987 domain-containing protein [Paracrocinitomix mangrovi]UKN02613.1 DUF1987 domain-containing protein [Paracrocinitomix mangrovi]